MNSIGIIVAMDKELSLLLPLVKNCSAITINDVVFHTGKIGNRDVVILKSGIGKVNAAIATLTLIDNFHVNLVINTGVAGGTGYKASIGDVVIADRIAYHDVWCGPGTKPGQMSGCPEYFSCPLGRETLESIEGIKYGLIASGDIFVAHKQDIDRIKALYPQVMAVDMESAAIAHVCYLKNVPFIALRVVSDTPGCADNVAQYENFWDNAPISTFNALNNILEII